MSAAGATRTWVALALAAVWLTWLALLRVRWSTGVEFFYGWMVLPLAGYLAWVRWEERPAPEPPRRATALAMVLTAVAGAALLGTAGLVLAPNPLWTMPMWVATAGAALVTLALAACAGGLRWVREAAFPVGFVFTALPWPSVLQVPVMSGLKAGNATLAAEVVSALGHPAIASGSVIEIGRGVVGVEDACSGLRALQAVIMVGLFFGETARLTGARRVALLAGGVFIALAANAARTVFLTLRMAQSGAAEVEAWHNPAGVIELVAALVGVVALAAWLGRKSEQGKLAERPSAEARDGDFAGLRGAAIAVAGVIGISWLATWGWYRDGDAEASAVGWTLREPPAAGWVPYRLAPAARELLGCDFADGWTTTAAWEGRQWVVLHVRWEKDPALRYAASQHSPEVCLPNIGARFDARMEPARVAVDGVTLTLPGMRFAAQGRALHVFRGLWDAERGRMLSGEENEPDDFTAERWRMVRERRKSLALEQLTIAVAGCESDAEALRRVEELLPRMLGRRAG